MWLTDIEAIDLPSVVSAHLPDDNEHLEKVALASQCSYTGSGWPIHIGPSEWDSQDQHLRLQHDGVDKNRGVRAYMEDVLGSLLCHNDVQCSDGRGMLLRYCAGYVPKFSDSFAKTWLNIRILRSNCFKSIKHHAIPAMASILFLSWDRIFSSHCTEEEFRF